MNALANVYQRFFPKPSAPISHNLIVRENPFINFPIDLILSILRHLPAHDLKQLGRTCRFFRDFTQDRCLDIAKMTLFKKMVKEKIGPDPQFLGFLLAGNKLVYAEQTHEAHTYRMTDLSQKTTKTVIDNQGKFEGELLSYFYFVYYDGSLKVKFIPKESPPREKMTDLLAISNNEKVINLSEIIGDRVNHEITIYRGDNNWLILPINGHVIAILDGEKIVHILPHDWENATETFLDCDIRGDDLILSKHLEYQQNFFILSLKRKCVLFERYSLSTGGILVSKSFPLESLNIWMHECHITDRYVIRVTGFTDRTDLIRVEVYDLNFNFVCIFSLFPWLYHVKKRNLYIYCYENRIVSFANNAILQIRSLENGKMIKEFYLQPQKDPLIKAEDLCRVSCNENLVAVSKKDSIGIYEIPTGKKIHRLATARSPVWVKLSSGHNLYYTIHDVKKKKCQYTRLKLRIKKNRSIT